MLELNNTFSALIFVNIYINTEFHAGNMVQVRIGQHKPKSCAV